VSAPETEWPSVADLEVQERELRWDRFDEDDAWRFGVALVTRAREQQLPLAVEILRADHPLFHAALPGTSPDNDAWLVRKARVVSRFHLSSLHLGQVCRDAGRTPEEMFQVPAGQFAAHGGAFPITVAGVGGRLRPAPARGPRLRGQRSPRLPQREVNPSFRSDSGRERTWRFRW
jgi:uncharacterized protein (UPF0303 family)